MCLLDETPPFVQVVGYMSFDLIFVDKVELFSIETDYEIRKTRIVIPLAYHRGN